MRCKKCNKKLNGVVVAECCLACFQSWQKRKINYDAKKRLEYLREEAIKERISYGELAELQSLIPFIDPSDVFLLELAGVPEFKE